MILDPSTANTITGIISALATYGQKYSFEIKRSGVFVDLQIYLIVEGKLIASKHEHFDTQFLGPNEGFIQGYRRAHKLIISLLHKQGKLA